MDILRKLRKEKIPKKPDKHTVTVKICRYLSIHLCVCVWSKEFNQLNIEIYVCEIDKVY